MHTQHTHTHVHTTCTTHKRTLDIKLHSNSKHIANIDMLSGYNAIKLETKTETRSHCLGTKY